MTTNPEQLAENTPPPVKPAELPPLRIKRYRLQIVQRLRSAVANVTSSSVTSERDWLREGFQSENPDMEDFLAEAPPRLIRDTHYVAMALLALLIIAACIVKVDIVVVAPGRLTGDEPPIVVQPMQLSMIREINVKIGDVVHKGDVLATLDPTFTQADKASLSTKQTAITAEMARVEAELNNKPLVLDESVAENRLQMTLYRNRTSQYAAKLQDFDQRLIRYKNDIRSSEESQATLSKQLAVSQELENMRSILYKKGTGSKVMLLDAQGTRLRTERELQAAVNHLDELRHDQKSVQAERQAYVDSWHRDLLENMVRLRGDASVTTENLTKAVRLNDLVVLRAPEDCIVLEIAKRSVGSVLHEAEPFATLIPVNAKLIADVNINSADVGYAKMGDEAIIKVDAFPYQRHGFLHGKVRSIGEDSFSMGNAQQSGATPVAASAGIYHHSQITLDNTNLEVMPEGSRLIPGMTVTAEIKVGTRRVISYFIYPITRSLHESIREP